MSLSSSSRRFSLFLNYFSVQRYSSQAARISTETKKHTTTATNNNNINNKQKQQGKAGNQSVAVCSLKNLHDNPVRWKSF